MNILNNSSFSPFSSKSSQLNKQIKSIKSPEPDNSRTNMLTPTKIKYLNGGYMSVQNSSSFKNQNNIEYIKQLEQRIKVLINENSNLCKKMSESGVQNRSNRIQIFMQKIKQQYEEKVNVLRMMVEQQIKQAMDIVGDMCEILKQKMGSIQERVQNVQIKINQTKISKIMEISHILKQSSKFQNLQSNCSSPERILIQISKRQQNSISDILCVSIPEEQQEESKNYTITIAKMEQQIEFLKKSIEHNNKIHREDKQFLKSQIKQKDLAIFDLNKKIEYLQLLKQTPITDFKINIQIKEELKKLQQNVTEIMKQLINKQQEYEKVIEDLKIKNVQIDNRNREMCFLRDKNEQSERTRVFLQEKVKYLQGNLNLIQKELKKNKEELQNYLSQKFRLQKESFSIVSSQKKRQKTSKNIINITSRIDKLLLLQEQRQQVERSFFETEHSEKQISRILLL